MGEAKSIRIAGEQDAVELARLFTDFNHEFDEPTPDPMVIAGRIGEHIREGHSTFVLAGERPDGFSQLRLRPSLYVAGLEAHLQELYVVPDRRGHGIGRALLEASIEAARRAGAEWMDLGTSEDDTAARGLYESAGFTNREGGREGPVMYVYERDL